MRDFGVRCSALSSHPRLPVGTSLGSVTRRLLLTHWSFRVNSAKVTLTITLFINIFNYKFNPRNSLVRTSDSPYKGSGSPGNCKGSIFCSNQVLPRKNFHSRPLVSSALLLSEVSEKGAKFETKLPKLSPKYCGCEEMHYSCNGRALDRVTKQKHRPNRQELSKKVRKL